jgi:MFS family permease
MPSLLPRGGLWRHRDFLKLWSAETVSQFGTQVTLLALPLAAILVLKASAFEVALLGAIEFLPFILFSLPAGVWVDRLPRRPILIVGDLGRAISLASVPIAYELGLLSVAQLYAVAFVNGILTVFFDVAYQSYLPSLVERDQLVEGNAKLELSRSAAQIAGPGVAGGLVGLVTAPIAIVADAVSFLASAAFVFAIRRAEPPPQPAKDPATGRGPGMRVEVAAGLRYVLDHRFLRNIAASTGSSNFFTSLAFSIFLVYAVRELGLTPELLGLIFGVSNVGILVGAATANRIAERIGVGPTIVGSIALGGPALLLVPLASREAAVPFFIVALGIGGFSSVVYNINQVSLRQAITPERMQGRMNATMRFIVWGTMPIGSIIGGALGTTLGLASTLWIGCIGSAFAFLPVLFSPVRGLRSIPEPIEQPAEPARGRLETTIDAIPEAAGGDKMTVGQPPVPSSDDR